ncbi:proton-associated sugar transporter A-like [Ochlerotatus camptorhynchus]|uniref:proton-associated sugar transporter A-like n=1 Tax=Ochlerotatus camptorhynchus TaxID=644619 RepID=UPI0031D5DA7C
MDQSDKQNDTAVNWQQPASDEEIMENMLQVRYDHAKSLEKDYSHMFRSKSRLELIRLSVYQVGVEFCYAAETAFVSPILLGNGLQHTFMTMVWAFAPTLGFFFAPLIASVSDQLRNSWGRRRPVLMVLGIAVIVGLLILPYGKQIGIWFGDDDVPVEQMSGFRWGVLITVIGLILTDFDIETSSGIGRTYFIDVCIEADHAKVLTTAMIIGGVGGSAGYVLGAIDWQQTDVGSLLGSNEATVFAGVVIVLAVTLVITLTSFREIALPLLEKDPLLQPVTEKKFLAEKNRQLAVYSISGPIAEPNKPGDLPVALQDEDDEKPLTFMDFFKNLRYMPKSLAILYLTQFLAQAGYMSYCLYFTDFVGSTVFGGDVAAPDGSPDLALYEEGVRYGCWGMALFAMCAALYSLVIERIIEYFSARMVLIGGLLVFSVGMLLVGIISTKWMVLVCSPTVGIMYASIYCVPFLLISRYHAKNSFAMKDGKYVENDRRRGFGADVSMLSSMLFLAQLLIALAIGSVIDALETTAVTVYSASLFSFLAAIAASQMLYMEA